MKSLKNNILVKIVLNTIALIYVIFDDVFVTLSKLLNRFVEKYQIFEKLNLKLKELNQYILLFLIISILGLSEVIGILSFVQLSEGHFYLFLVLYIVKFVPFFMVSYVFKQTKEILLAIEWFNYCYIKVCFVTDYLKHMEIVVKIKELKDEYKVVVKAKLKEIYNKF